jgi:hypothetical protein
MQPEAVGRKDNKINCALHGIRGRKVLELRLLTQQSVWLLWDGHLISIPGRRQKFSSSSPHPDLYHQTKADSSVYGVR